MTKAGRKKMPLIRQGLFVLGILLIIVAPLVGAIPGPGGVFVFARGLGLVLKYSEWAKRQYVRFKRRHRKRAAGPTGACAAPAPAAARSCASRASKANRRPIDFGAGFAYRRRQRGRLDRRPFSLISYYEE